MRRLSLGVLALLGCGGGDAYMIVTIDSVPAVHDVARVQVDLDNEGRTAGDSFATDDLAFPATFSISATGRTGNLAITVSAFDDAGLLVGRGTTSTTVDQPTAALTLDSADFVINTDFAANQFPSNDFESHGFQVGATPDGTWTAVYRDDCSAPCNMFARRFDVAGRPIASGLAAGTNGFAISTEVSDGFFTTPATASLANATVALWNFSEPPPSTDSGIACRAMDSSGNGVGPQVTISTDTVLPFAVSVTPVGTQRFVAAWNARTTNNVTRAALIDAQCQPGALVDVSTVVGTGGAIRPSVAANGTRILYAWVNDDNARFRLMTDANTPLTVDQLLVTPTATEEVRFVRVTKFGTGFAIFVRWATLTGDGPGKIEMYRIDSNGALQGPPVLVSTKTSSDFQSSQGFSATTREDDGTVLVAWHTCGEINDGDNCGVFARAIGADGQPSGEELSLATTTKAEQTSPSVVGLPGAFAAVWADSSLDPPDIAGKSVRGRVLYPPIGSSARAKPQREPQTTLPGIELDPAR